MFCKNCGKQLQEGKAFCTECGAPVEKPVEATKPQPPAQPPAPVQPQPPAQPPATPAAAQAPIVPPSVGRKRKVWPIVVGVVAGIAVVTAVVLVLVLVVFKSPSPQAAVEKFFTAAENKDADAAMALMDKEYFKGDTALEKLWKEEVFSDMPADVDFVEVKYRTNVKGDKATVEVVEGKVTYTEDGKEKTQDLTEIQGEKVFDMVKKGGEWLISPATFGGVFAESYRQAGDKVFTESILPAAAKLETQFTDLGNMMSAQPTPTAAQIQLQEDVVKATLDSYKAAAKDAKAAYEKVKDLSGRDVENYQKYAEAAIGFIDASISLFDESVALIDYVIAEKAQSEAGGVVDMNAYNARVSDASAKITQLENQMNEYQQQMEDYEQKL